MKRRLLTLSAGVVLGVAFTVSVRSAYPTLPMRHLLLPMFHDVLNGRPAPDAHPVVARAVTGVARFLLRLLGGAPQQEPPPEGSRPPDAGKPAPVSPSPAHHLVAAKSLPPEEGTQVSPAN